MDTAPPDPALAAVGPAQPPQVLPNDAAPAAAPNAPAAPVHERPEDPAPSDEYIYIDPQDMILRDEVYALVDQLRREFSQKIAQVRANYELELGMLRAQLELLQKSQRHSLSSSEASPRDLNEPTSPHLAEPTEGNPKIALHDDSHATDSATAEKPESKEKGKSFLVKLKGVSLKKNSHSHKEKEKEKEKEKKRRKQHESLPPQLVAAQSSDGGAPEHKKKKNVWDSFRKKIGLSQSHSTSNVPYTTDHSTASATATHTEAPPVAVVESKPRAATISLTSKGSRSNLGVDLDKLFQPSSPRSSPRDETPRINQLQLAKGEKTHSRWGEAIRKSTPGADQLGAEVDYASAELTTLPSVVSQKLETILFLSLGNNALTAWPALSSNTLVELDLSLNTISTIPASISQLPNLRCLYLFGNKLSALPEEFAKLSNLEYLDLAKNSFIELPTTVCQLTHLKELQIFSNKISSLPAEIGNLQKLKAIDLGENPLRVLPAEFCKLTELVDLNLYLNKLNDLPQDLGNLVNLTELNLAENFLKDLPLSCGKLKADLNINVTQNAIANLKLREAINAGSVQVMAYLRNRLTDSSNPQPIDAAAAALDAEAAALLEEMMSDDFPSSPTRLDSSPQLKDFRASVIASDFRKMTQSPNSSSYNFSTDKVQRLKELVADVEPEEQPPEYPKADPVLEQKVLILAAWGKNIVTTEFQPLIQKISTSIDTLKTDEDMEYPASVVHLLEKGLKRVEPHLPAELHDTVMDSLLTDLTKNLEKRRASKDLFNNPNLESERSALQLSSKQLAQTFNHIAVMFETCPDTQIVLELVNVVKELKAKLPAPPAPAQPASEAPASESATAAATPPVTAVEKAPAEPVSEASASDLTVAQ